MAGSYETEAGEGAGRSGRTKAKRLVIGPWPVAQAPPSLAARQFRRALGVRAKVFGIDRRDGFDGKRGLSKTNIKRLAEYFRVSPEVFL